MRVPYIYSQKFKRKIKRMKRKKMNKLKSIFLERKNKRKSLNEYKKKNKCN